MRSSAGEALLVRRARGAEQLGLGVDEAGDRGIHPAETGRRSCTTRMPRPSFGSVRRVHELPRSTSRSMRLVIVPLETRVCCSSCFGLSWYGLPGAAERREHVELPGLELGAREGGAPGPVEVLGQPADAGEHLQRREIQVGALAQPGIDDAVDFVTRGHSPIIGGGCRAPDASETRNGCAATSRSAGSIWQT